MAKLSKEMWVKSGFRLLQKEGYHAIKLENLCEKFNVTRGSFYHHFDSMKSYIIELLKFWESESIGKVRKAISQSGDTNEKFRIFLHIIYALSGKTEISFRVWALHDRTVRKYVDYVDRERIKITADIYSELGVQRAKAEELAQTGYLVWLGVMSYHLYNDKDKGRSIRLVSSVFATMRENMTRTG